MADKAPQRLSALFRIVNLTVLPGWLLMIFAPKSRWTRRLIEDDTLFLGLGGVYAAMLAQSVAANPGGASDMMNPTLENIDRLFKQGGYKGTFAGWTHYLVFDFFVGRSLFQDAQERDLPHWLLAPALLLTFMSGPVGLAFYRIVVRLRGGR